MSGDKINALMNSVLKSDGQNTNTSSVKPKMVFPAIIVPNGTTDPLQQNRIRARIVTVDENGNIKGKKSDQEEKYDAYTGKDKDIPDEKLPWAMPLIPEYLHVRPLPGEMVFLFLENPNDTSCARFWVGPIINSQRRLKGQSYEQAYQIFLNTQTSENQNTTDKKSETLFPGVSDIAIQGRNDADLMLKVREAYLVAGKFNKDSFDPNEETPSFLQIIQKESEKLLKLYSQANLQSTNVNIYSPRGKFRSKEISIFEKNGELESFGDFANTLHPAVFGDELIKLLEKLIQFCLTHIHTPQKPAHTDNDSLNKFLSEYSVEGKLQDLISKHIRIN